MYVTSSYGFSNITLHTHGNVRLFVQVNCRLYVVHYTSRDTNCQVVILRGVSRHAGYGLIRSQSCGKLKLSVRTIEV
jgi:hypothetical protein